ncbi:hypothetical protein AV530_015302 [Patagioenas fasciata monilis]|uniref:Uncharacterized protein n=1 Tax=Patagioenas fasciata monilis TaxID=372326 RepID=A0A1V4K1M7_PATFA|nr:hypothetical protein AV530_015302 [Patagioenas fasciata monilis]
MWRARILFQAEEEVFGGVSWASAVSAALQRAPSVSSRCRCARHSLGSLLKSRKATCRRIEKGERTLTASSAVGSVCEGERWHSAAGILASPQLPAARTETSTQFLNFSLLITQQRAQTLKQNNMMVFRGTWKILNMDRIHSTVSFGA